MNKQLKTPSRTRQPLQEVNGQSSRAEPQEKGKFSLRDEVMLDVDEEDRNLKKNRTKEEMEADTRGRVVEANPNWPLKSI